MSVDEKMTAIADAIRRYTGRSDRLSLEGMATGVSEVFGVGNNNGYNEGREEGLSEGRTQGYGLGFEEGKAAEREKFWERLQSNGKPTRYYWRFAYSNWNDDIYNPKYDIVGDNASNALGNTFYTSGITDTKVVIDATRVPTGLDATFYWARKMQRIRKLVITENTTFKQSFTDCSALISIDEIEGAIGNNLSLAWSTLLNKDSITNLINALSTNTTGLTITLSLTAVNNAFTAEEWDALEATKTNWTISLV